MRLSNQNESPRQFQPQQWYRFASIRPRVDTLQKEKITQNEQKKKERFKINAPGMAVLISCHHIITYDAVLVTYIFARFFPFKILTLFFLVESVDIFSLSYFQYKSTSVLSRIPFSYWLRSSLSILFQTVGSLTSLAVCNYQRNGRCSFKF